MDGLQFGAEDGTAVRDPELKRPDARPQFLRICWETANEEGGRVVEATLCRDHRRAIALEYPNARGSGELGDSCDACEGREPRI